jgi:hypothetical protein
VGINNNKCIHCGNITKLISINKGYRKFCSVKCAKQYQSKNSDNISLMLEKRKKTNIKKYGTDHPMKTEIGKQHFNDAIKKKYNVDHYSKTPEFKEKCKETWTENYGVDHPSKIKATLDKIKKTNLEKYGVDNASKSPEIIEKIKSVKLSKYGNATYNNRDKYKETCIEKYNVNHHMKCDDYKNIVMHKRAEKFLDKLFDGTRLKNLLIPMFKRDEFTNINEKYKFKCVKCNTEFVGKMDDGKIPRCPTCHPYLGNISFVELDFLNYLNIDERQFVINNYKIDGFDILENIIYEFLGDFWHGNPRIFNPNDINKVTKCTFGELYEKTILKFINLYNLGYKIKYIWENEWLKWVKSNNSTLLEIKEFDINNTSI